MATIVVVWDGIKMPEKVWVEYKCSVCGKRFKNKNAEKTERMALECEQTHDVVYVPLQRSDLQALLAFIVSKNESFLTPGLMATLRSYRSLR